jgi:hypothetical protein
MVDSQVIFMALVIGRSLILRLASFNQRINEFGHQDSRAAALHVAARRCHEQHALNEAFCYDAP